MKSIYDALSKDGFRVLAIATKKLDVDDYVYDIADESNMVFVGFTAFLDPPKKDSAKALKELSQLGIEIKILTGDSGVLTEKVCRDLNIPIKGIALGKDIDTFSSAEVAKFASRTTIFARVSPAEKERIIRALREIPGNVVGYMGDGINDVTALVASDVGISVANAVPVVKDAASIILLEKDFSVLKEGVQEGRRTFQNTLKYIKMWISSNFGNMFSMMRASAVLPFLPMTPQQILLNNFLYDASQVGIPTDRVDKKSTLRPSVWDFRDMKKFMIIFGVLSSAFDFLTFGFLLFVLQLEERSFQTGWFLQSLATQVLVVFVVRTKITPFFRSLPSTFLAVGVISFLILGWAIALSPIGALFQFETLSFVAIFGIISITAVYLLVVDRVKLYFEKF